MARIAFALFLALAVLSAGTHGYKPESARSYVSRILQRASYFLMRPRASHPTQDFVCKKDGLFSNPSDCGTYFRCRDGLRSVQPCANERHFNNVSEQCEEPCDARCDTSIACECGWDSCTTTEMMSTLVMSTESAPIQESESSRFECPVDGYYPNLMNCNQYFQCTGGRSNVMSCPVGLHFSALTQRCETPCVAQCDSAMSCRWKSKASKKTPTISVPGFTCPAEGLYRNPGNCGTFIQCSNGRKYVMECPKGLHFSEDINRCERPCDAHCDPELAEKCGWYETPTPEDDFEVCRRRPYTGPCKDYVTRYYFDVEDGTCKTFRYGGCHGNGNNFKSERMCSIKCLRRAPSASQTESDFIESSAPVCTRDGIFANPEDCNSFVQCTGGQSYVMRCPRGLHFLEESGLCVAPCDARCDDSIAPDCNNREYSSRKSFEPPKSPAASDIACFKEGSYPNPENCSSYVQCSRGLPRVVDCPENQHFSQLTQKCEAACEARCDPNIAEECGWEDEEFAIVRRAFFCLQNGLHPNPEDCATYIHCSEGQGYIMPCPKGLHFSPHSQRCEEPCEARCYAPMAEQCGWNKGEYLETKPHLDSVCRESGGVYHRHRNPENCSTYVQCVRGHGYVANCPFGMHFSELTLGCVTPCKAHCDPSLAQACEWEERSYSLKQPVFDFSCLRNGLFENYADCGTFIQCTGGSPYLIDCIIGLHFSPVTKRCELPCVAKCDLSIEEACNLGDQTGFGKYPNIPRRGSLKQQPLYHEHTCTEDDFFPDTKDCGKYIQCSDGHSFVMSCPEGMHFGQKFKRCEPPCDAYCDRTIADRCGWDHKVHAPWKSDFKECKPNATYTLPGDCTRYVQCTEQGSGAYVIACPEGRHFSGASCEDPCEARCDLSLAHSCHWDQPALSVTESDFSRPISTDDSTGVVDFICGQDGLYKNLDDCAQYYRCYAGEAHLRSCPEGQHFSEMTQRCESQCDAHCNLTMACECDWPECGTKLKADRQMDVHECEAEPEAGPCQENLARYYYDVDGGRCRRFDYGGCGGNGNNFETREECDAVCKQRLVGSFRCPDTTGKFGDFPDCTKYYECKRGVPTLKRCPKGTAFDHLKSKCVTEFIATCVYQCREPDAVYPYERDCRKYIDCVNWVSKVERCPSGTAFDPSKRDCVDTEGDACPRS